MLFNPFRTFQQRLTNSYRIPRRRKSRHSLKTPVSSAVELLEQRLLLTCAVDGDGWLSADGGCKDLRTGLVFSIEQTATVGLATFSWNGAVGHAGRSVEAGYDDWRLPTIDELVAARENGFNDHGDKLFDTFRWSSDTRGKKDAYYYAFSTGEIRLTSKMSTANLFIVRDSNPVAGPWIYVDDVTVAEADIKTDGDPEETTAIFTVRVDGDAGQTGTVDVFFNTADGTAKSGVDYIAIAESNDPWTISIGDQNQTIEVTIYGDTMYDPVEDFQLVLSSTNGSIVNSPATARIFDNEATPLTASFSGDEFAVAGEDYLLGLHLSDPGARNDMAEWVISWGDETTTTVDGTTQFVSHLYGAGETFDITATFDIDKFDTVDPVTVQQSGVGEFFGEFVPDWDYPSFGLEVDVDVNGNVYVIGTDGGSNIGSGVWRYDAAGNPFPAPNEVDADFIPVGTFDNIRNVEVDDAGNVYITVRRPIGSSDPGVFVYDGTTGLLIKSAVIDSLLGLALGSSNEVFVARVYNNENGVRQNDIVKVDLNDDSNHVVLTSETVDANFRDIEYANGSFYVGVQLTRDQQRAEIWRYDPDTPGDPGTTYTKTILVGPEAGVLNDRADYIKIGPDGMLYVMHWQNELTIAPLAEPGILMFDSETGDYVETVISADDGEFNRNGSSFAFDQRGNLVIVSGEGFVFDPDTGELHRSRVVRAQGPMGTTASARQSGNPDTVLTVSLSPEAVSQVSVNDVTLEEGNSGETAFTFTVTRTGLLDGTTEVYIETSPGTATQWTDGGDYTSTNRQFEFFPGDTEFLFTVYVHGDKDNEPDETFYVNLIVLSGGTADDDQGVGTILNDDSKKGGGKPPRSSSTFAAASSSSPTDTSTSDSTSTDSTVTQPTDPTLLIVSPVPTEEESDDESSTQDDPAILLPEEQADLDSLFGDLDGSLQEELLAV